MGVEHFIYLLLALRYRARRHTSALLIAGWRLLQTFISNRFDRIIKRTARTASAANLHVTGGGRGTARRRIARLR